MGEQSDAVLLCGRYFNLRELLEIQVTVSMFPKLSRYELSQTICEHLDWFTPSGQYKTASCIQLLEKMEGQGLITLPPKRKPRGLNRKKITFGPCTAPAPLVAGSLRDHEPLAVEPVNQRADSMLWNEYVHRYHILGYKIPFGAHQRYFIDRRGRSPFQRSCGEGMDCFFPLAW
jgi:hypothetical protein